VQKRLGRQGPGIQVALDQIAAELVEHLQLALGFHAFGDDAQMQGPRQGDDRSDHGLALFAGAEIVDERAVDLHFRDGQRGQVGQG
jgi:hypothetical protein